MVVGKVFGGVDMLCDSGSGTGSGESCGNVGCARGNDCVSNGGHNDGVVSAVNVTHRCNGRKGLFMRLVGQGSKPFDCVGTANEAAAAVHLTAARYSKATRGGGIGSGGGGDSAGCDGWGGSGGNGGTSCTALPPLLLELCAYLEIKLTDDNTAPVVVDEDAILKHWGIV